MENLTKHQIVLLTLLVSFVTSIATGIVTVALMNQAPVGVTQTIDRVIERTIQNVVATSTQSDDNSSVIKETVVVSEDDQVVSAINTNAKSTVRIYTHGVDQNTGLQTTDFVALGAVVSADGIIATDNGAIFPSGKYFVKTDDGTTYDLAVARSVSGESIALLKLATSSVSVLGLSTVSLSTQGDLNLGQAVVYIGGDTKNTVATGIVSSLATKDVAVSGMSSSTAATASSTTAQTQKVVTSIQTSIPTDSLISGGLLLNLSGELVGIDSTGDSIQANSFAPVSDIVSELSSLASSQITK